MSDTSLPDGARPKCSTCNARGGHAANCPEESAQKGALRLLLCSRPDASRKAPLDDAQLLAWLTPPSTARWDLTLDGVDLGDDECKGLPAMPNGRGGLWILRWEYSMGKGEWDQETAFYADACQWARPTIQDLIAFGVLPDV